MIDAIETITEAIPCNIVYGRKQAAEGIARALSAAGFTIMSKEDVEAVRDKALDEAAGIGSRILIPVDKWGDRKEAKTFNAAVEQYALEIRSLKSGGRE